MDEPENKQPWNIQAAEPLINSEIALDSLDSPASENFSPENSPAAFEFGAEPLLAHYKRSPQTKIRRNFFTIDWFYSKFQLSRFRLLEKAKNSQRGWRGAVKNLANRSQAMILLFLVGLATAIMAFIIHVVSDFLSDLKGGVCSSHWVSTKRICCLNAVAGQCADWREWHEMIFGGEDDDINNDGGYWFNFFIYASFVIPLGTISSWLVAIYCPEAAGSGISEIKTILSGIRIRKFLGIRTLFIKVMGLVCAKGAGLHGGIEGPICHISSCLGNIFCRIAPKYAHSEGKKREILAASTAAGISAAFGAPIGGVLFTMESLSSYFPSRSIFQSFFCSSVAAVCIGWFNPFQTGKFVQFAVERTTGQWYFYEVPFFILLGCLGGALGALFIKFNVSLQSIIHSHPYFHHRPVFYVFLLSLLTAIVNYSNVFLRESSGELLNYLFNPCSEYEILEDSHFRREGEDSVLYNLCSGQNQGFYIFWLLWASGLKFLLTLFTYGSSNIPAGVFMPALTIGACVGRAVGWLLSIYHDLIGDAWMFASCSERSSCVNPGLYAIIGAASMLGGVTRLNMAITVIMLEITGTLDFLLPVMIAVVCAKWTGDAMKEAPLYAQLIRLHGYPFLDANALIEGSETAQELMTPKKQLICLKARGGTIEEIRSILEKFPYHGFPIVEEEEFLEGYIGRKDLELSMKQFEENSSNRRLPISFLPVAVATAGLSEENPQVYHDLSFYVDHFPTRILPTEPLIRFSGFFQSLGVKVLFIVEKRGRLLGMMKKKDFLWYLERRKYLNSS